MTEVERFVASAEFVALADAHGWRADYKGVFNAIADYAETLDRAVEKGTITDQERTAFARALCDRTFRGKKLYELTREEGLAVYELVQTSTRLLEGLEAQWAPPEE